MKRVFVYLMFLCFCLGTFPAFAESEPGSQTRVNDPRLHHPFKSGLFTGASLFLYKTEREEIELSIPTDAQIAIGFESHLRRHGQLSYVIGIIIGLAYTSFILFSIGLIAMQSKKRIPSKENAACQSN